MKFLHAELSAKMRSTLFSCTRGSRVEGTPQKFSKKVNMISFLIGEPPDFRDYIKIV